MYSLVIMSSLSKLTFSSSLITVIILGLCMSAQAQPPVNMISIVPDEITIPVCNQFKIEIVTSENGNMYGAATPAITQIYFYLEWDPTQMEIKLDTVTTKVPSGWSVSAIPPITQQPPYSQLIFTAIGTPGVDAAHEWLELEYHCIDEGTSDIQILGLTINTVGLPTDYAVFDASVNQIPAPAPVGGIVIPTNRLEILTPYVALAGLIVAISTVYVFKKRKD